MNQYEYPGPHNYRPEGALQLPAPGNAWSSGTTEKNSPEGATQSTSLSRPPLPPQLPPRKGMAAPSPRQCLGFKKSQQEQPCKGDTTHIPAQRVRSIQHNYRPEGALQLPAPSNAWGSRKANRNSPVRATQPTSQPSAFALSSTTIAPKGHCSYQPQAAPGVQEQPTGTAL